VGSFRRRERQRPDLLGVKLIEGCRAGRLRRAASRIQPLAHLIAGIKESRSYRNGKFGTFEHDTVSLPYRLGLLQYVHPTALIDVSAVPPAGDQWGIFSYHHMPLYAQAIAQGAIRPPAS
jgi:hypothetical protein